VERLIQIIIALALSILSTSLKAQDDISKLTIPNVITPNGDGLNDRFEILTSGGDTFPGESAPSLVVYNRYGKVVFEANRYINQWDASELSDGRYFFSLQFRTGESFSGNIAVYH
jgi:gliding motility-associated-like protein